MKQSNERMNKPKVVSELNNLISNIAKYYYELAIDDQKTNGDKDDSERRMKPALFEQQITKHFLEQRNTKTLQRLCSDLGVDLHKGRAIAQHGYNEAKDRVLSAKEILEILCEEPDCIACPKIARAIYRTQKNKINGKE